VIIRANPFQVARQRCQQIEAPADERNDCCCHQPLANNIGHAEATVQVEIDY
jgi:hypothetical protein